MNIEIPIKSLNDSIPIPEFAHPGDAGFDLRSAEDLVLEPFERALIPCGFSIEIPAGYAGLVIPRSGLAIKQGLSIVNAPGLIDSGFRGEIKVIAINLDKSAAIEIKAGDRIAQMMIIEHPVVTLVPSDELSDSARGERGFGSSGVS